MRTHNIDVIDTFSYLKYCICIFKKFIFVARYRSVGRAIALWCDESSDRSFMVVSLSYFSFQGVRCSSVIRAIALWCDESSDRSFMVVSLSYFSFQGVRCSSVIRAFAHGAMNRWIDPSWLTH